MKNDTGLTEASRQYAAAHAAHYGTKNLREALEFYMGIVAAHPDSQEAEYSRSQIQNIVTSVVPKKELLDAGVDKALACFERERSNAREAGSGHHTLVSRASSSRSRPMRSGPPELHAPTKRTPLEGGTLEAPRLSTIPGLLMRARQVSSTAEEGD